jgi:hypothetical protein
MDLSKFAKDEFKALSPTGILGYGFPVESFKAGLAEKPDLLAVDAGSVDPGPFYLGSGKPFTDRTGVKRDLKLLLEGAIELDVPLIIGTAGGSGAKPHLEWCRKILEELAAEEKLSFKMGVISADVEKKTVLGAIKAGRVEALDGLPELDEKTVEETGNIVAQMGVEPIIGALKAGCQVVLAGRAYDPSVFAAAPIMLGFDPGLAIHMGKILECAAIAADPGSGSDCVLGILKKDSFVLKALNPIRKFTASSTAAHTLYEKSDPCHLPGPGGQLDLTEVSFNEIGDGMVEVRGSKFVKSPDNKIKLEGARLAGYRTISIAGTRDPIMISKIESILDAVRKQAENILQAENIDAKLNFHLYGKNAVMESREPGASDYAPRELGILIEVVAPVQEKANTVCSIVRSSMLHYGYEGRIATAGNLAFPFSPSDISAGAVYEFSIYHLMEIGDANEIFKLETVQI